MSIWSAHIFHISSLHFYTMLLALMFIYHRYRFIAAKLIILYIKLVET